MLKNSLHFLKLLSVNNDREWFNENKSNYQEARNEFESLIQEVINSISRFDPDLRNTMAKDCIYRIYRDVRFSKNKQPYKTNFAALLAEHGRKSEGSFYYLQIEPGNISFLGAGIYMPVSEKLKKVRQEIDYNAEEFLGILNKNSFKKYFPELHGEKLKRAPKGYSPDDPNIELLKFKSYIVTYNFTDKELNEKSFVSRCEKLFKESKPLNDFINRALE